MSVLEPPISIRRASTADAAAVSACVQAAYARWVPVIGTVPAPMRQNYEEVLATEVAFVAEVAGAVVGVLVLAVTEEGFLLENVAVHPGNVRSGLGGKLLELAEREAVTRGYASIYLYTHERMADNIALYRRRGYREYSRRTEDGFARVYMCKALH